MVDEIPVVTAPCAQPHDIGTWSRHLCLAVMMQYRICISSIHVCLQHSPAAAAAAAYESDGRFSAAGQSIEK